MAYRRISNIVFHAHILGVVFTMSTTDLSPPPLPASRHDPILLFNNKHKSIILNKKEENVQNTKSYALLKPVVLKN